ncbi:DUF3124 domain-containing protein [Olleya sp. HaHaR_3_96]|uniref:DUF3124 domain-containing protein n=1 Tax=Olleya sp. HaHaR_3_96 TaxID=2745560 RepID=UPI001C4EDF57|nr:DUF3124 domain-containing protein [Olleya sp. HaHaR_3_96]QXP58286.1 DUF3124 domain-containing protein [Olleya sp. HaHaR_3_96]
MKYVVLFIIVLTSFSCETKDENAYVPSNNWKAMQWNKPLTDSLLVSGSTYLSVYSQIYSVTEHKTHNLTATVSLRNINKKDTIFIKEADFYNTNGDLIKAYFTETIYVKPMQTIEIVINERDIEGGTGANFVFDWIAAKDVNPPYFEAVQISTSGQQGLSFTTTGIEIE